MFGARIWAFPRGLQTLTVLALLAFIVPLVVGIFPKKVGAGTAVVYLTSGTSWTVPTNWSNASNTIEVIGAGGGGGSANNTQSTGGGGGGYSKIGNLDLSGVSSVTYQVGTAGASNSAGGDTFFNRTSGSATTCSAGTMSVCAKGGSGGTTSGSGTFSLGGSGGAASSGIGDVKYSGGKGGDKESFNGPGGGGAAGPNGDGFAGTNASSTSGVAGGAGDAGFGGAGGTGGTAPGNPGGAGTEWTTHGSGGGGEGCESGTAAGGTGGAYGGGGGGACQQGGSTGGAGLIRITYEASYGLVTSDDSASASVSWGTGRRVVFTSNNVGYVFYRDSDSICKYSKTTDGGFTWGTAVTVDSQTDCFAITVWYDRWTPGDTSGTYVHIATADTGSSDLWYTRLDTSSDTLTTATTTTSAQGGSLTVSDNFPSITKGTDSTLYMALVDNSDSYIVECSSTCTTAGNWSETGTNPMDLVGADIPILVPLSGGNILLVQFDDSADDVRSKVWDNSAWSAGWTTVDAAATNNTTYDSNISVTVNSAGTTVYLAYLADVATIDGNDDDLRTATYSGGSWSGTTAVETNTTDGLKAVSIGLIGSDVYVGYGAADGTTNAKLCTKISHNSMSTWRFNGCYTGPAPANPTTWDMKDLSLEVINSNDAIGAVWFDDTGDDQIFFSIAAFNSGNTLTFSRDVAVSGGLAVLGGVSKGSGTFVIDHPLDPKNKLLFHSFVESPDVKNIYDGITELNDKGEATIELPSYFLALNKDFRYLATAIAEPMPELHLDKEVRRKWWIFGKPVVKIAGGAPNGRVSWQVTGIRHDPLIEAHPVEVEVEKGQGQLVGKGECIHEDLCE